jgi:hypothetical protein
MSREEIIPTYRVPALVRAPGDQVALRVLESAGDGECLRYLATALASSDRGPSPAVLTAET